MPKHMKATLRPRTILAAALGMGLLAVLSTRAARAEEWPQWRGPFFNGSTTETKVPERWSKTDSVAWATPLPGKSGATPVVWGDSVFVPSPDEQKNLLLLCINGRDGKVRWERTVGAGDVNVGKNNMASPSAVTDGKLVVAMFGTGDLAAFDFAGEKLWARNLAQEHGKFSMMWLYGASPLLYRGKLYVSVLQRYPFSYKHAADDKPARESFLLCIDPQTGKDLWRHVRQTDAAAESQEAYTTPFPYEGGRGAEIIVFGADYVTSHRADTGEELWRCGSLNPNKLGNWRTVPSPVAAPGFIYACLARGNNPMLAIKAGGTGHVTDAQIAWRLTEFTPDVPTPLYCQNMLFVLDGNRQMMTCLDPNTGAKKWQGSLGVKEVFSASPTAADGKIYCISENGTAVVLSAGDEFKILSTITMGESPVMSSIAIAAGRLLIRTSRNLYCIAGKPPDARP